MDQYFQKLGELFRNGDPTVTSWFLVRNNYLPFVLSGLYVLVSTYIGPALMRNRKPFNLRMAMIVLNLFLVAAYVYCFGQFLWHVQYMDYENLCVGNIIRKGHFTYTMAEICWVVYILKYVEFLDTIFFVLRKKEKQISFLHVTHHAALPIVGWLNMRTETAGFQMIPANVNAFVHIVMYSYYGLSAIGPSVRKYLWWKKYITQLQIIQFIVIILLVTVLVPLTGCNMGIMPFVCDILFAPLFLYLFYKFYMENYKSRKTSKEDGMNVKKTENKEKSRNSFSNGKVD